MEKDKLNYSMQQPVFYDEFNIDEQYHKLKKLVNALERDVYKFVSPTKNKCAGTRARKYLREIKIVSAELRRSILKQKQHNDSQY